MLATGGKAEGRTFLGEAGFRSLGRWGGEMMGLIRAMHDLPTEGWTFGMHTFYTQVTSPHHLKMEEKLVFSRVESISTMMDGCKEMLQ